MLDVLSIVYHIADLRTSSILRCTCKKLSKLKKIPKREVKAYSTEYRVDGMLHREDGPAIEHADGTREWYLYGLRHRRDGPAIEDISMHLCIDKRHVTVTREGIYNEYTYIELVNRYTPSTDADFVASVWLLYGKIHREDGPAIEYANGCKEWYIRGKLHREDGPAIEYANGCKEWYIYGKLHREDGPAIESGVCNEWYVYGQRHREDGPALEYSDGSRSWYLYGKLHRLEGAAVEWHGTKEWYLYGKRYPEGSSIEYTARSAYHVIHTTLVQKIYSCTIL